MQTGPVIALATSAEVAELDDEGQALAAELRHRGAQVTAAVWDDPSVNWADFDLVVVRSTWDYALRRDQFVTWAQSLSDKTTIANNTETLAWSTDKHYLIDLAHHGVPIVPSTFIEPGQPSTHELLAVEHVVKPAVSAGSKDALRLASDDCERSVAHVEAITGSGRTALIQTYLWRIDTDGETALLYVDGQFSHAVSKAAILKPGAELVEGLFATEVITARKPSEAERAVAEKALAAIPSHEVPLYARVDLLPSDDGPIVLELELAEPSMFLSHAEGSVQRFADAILARVISG